MLLYETIIIQKVTVYKEPLVPDSALFMPSGLRKTASLLVTSSSLVARKVLFQA